MAEASAAASIAFAAFVAFSALITLAALAWALLNKQSVFNLVIMAWSGLASAFAPLLIYLCLGAQPSRQGSVIAIFGGLGTALLWRFLGWHATIYEGMPGILIGLLILVIDGRLSAAARNESLTEKETYT